MIKKKILSVLVAVVMLISQGITVFAQSREYDSFERLANLAANLYIDESVSGEYLMTEALKKVMKEKPELTVELIKAAFESLDDYSEYYTREEYELFNKNINHIV